MPRGRPKKNVNNSNNSNNTTKISTTESYEIKGQPKTISAMCRQSISYRGNYYTFEYKEERELPLITDIDLIKEKDALWFSVNSEVDNQINNLIEFLENKQNESNDRNRI